MSKLDELKEYVKKITVDENIFGIIYYFDRDEIDTKLYYWYQSLQPLPLKQLFASANNFNSENLSKLDLSEETLYNILFRLETANVLPYIMDTPNSIYILNKIHDNDNKRLEKFTEKQKEQLQQLSKDFIRNFESLEIREIIRSACICTLPSHYSGRPTTMDDINAKRLMTIYYGIKNMGKEKAKAFLKMVSDMESLACTPFLNSLYNLCDYNFDYNPSLIVKSSIDLDSNSDDARLMTGMATFISATNLETPFITDQIKWEFKQQLKAYDEEAYIELCEYELTKEKNIRQYKKELIN